MAKVFDCGSSMHCPDLSLSDQTPGPHGSAHNPADFQDLSHQRPSLPWSHDISRAASDLQFLIRERCFVRTLYNGCWATNSICHAHFPITTEALEILSHGDDHLKLEAYHRLSLQRRE